jgi:glycosyltransferase involved in cell wall biosynthesis
MEHFGISTVEAMASGCIPIVYGGGGQLEIVRHGIDGIIWNKEQELIESTSYDITHPRLRMRMQESAMERAKGFNQFKFYAAFDRLIERII